MAEVLLILSYICAKELLMSVPLLLIVGYLIKHYTTLPNVYIPYIETGLGLIIGLLYGGLVVGGFKNVIMYGGQGLVLGFISISLYDAVHGITKHNCNLETKMEEKKKLNLWDHKAFVYTCAFLTGVVITGLIKLIMYGVDGMVYYFVNEAIFAVLILLLVDFFLKFSTDKTVLVWQYWVMDGFMVLAVLTYAIASLMTTWVLVWVLLCVSALFVACAGLWCNKMYKPAVAKKSEAVYQKALEDVNKLTTPEEIVNYFIERK